jgi:hypothetical protein
MSGALATCWYICHVHWQNGGVNVRGAIRFIKKASFHH